MNMAGISFILVMLIFSIFAMWKIHTHENKYLLTRRQATMKIINESKDYLD